MGDLIFTVSKGRLRGCFEILVGAVVAQAGQSFVAARNLSLDGQRQQFSKLAVGPVFFFSISVPIGTCRLREIHSRRNSQSTLHEAERWMTARHKIANLVVQMGRTARFLALNHLRTI